MTASILEKLNPLHADNYGWALACCSWEQSMAEDVLQEAYLRALDGRASFSGKASLKTWFFAVIKRVASEIYRTQKRHAILNLKIVSAETTASSEAAASVDNHGPSDLLDAEDNARQLRNALKELPQRQREVLHLVFYAGLTLEETAQTLGINLGSVRTHYHRGKTRLAELLDINRPLNDGGAK